MRYRPPPMGFCSALEERRYDYLPPAPTTAYHHSSHFHAPPQYHHHRGHGFPPPPMPVDPCYHDPPGSSPPAAALLHNLVKQAPAPVGVRSPHTLSVASRGCGRSGNFRHNLLRGSVEMDRGDGRQSVSDTQLPQTAPSADVNCSSPASDPTQKKHGQRPAHAPAVGNSAKAQLIPLPPVARCDICKASFTNSEGLERHKNGRQHKKSLILQRFGKIPMQKEVEEKPQQTLALTTEQKMEGETQSQTDPTEAVKERHRLKRKAARRFRKDVKNMRYFRPPVAPPKEQPRCCTLCCVTYQTKDTFEAHLMGKKHISRLSLCEDEDAAYGLMNVHISPDQLSISREQVPMFYGLKTREMFQQEARGEAIVLQYDWRPKEEVLIVNGGYLENVDSYDQKVKNQIGFASEVAMLNEAHVAVPEYDVVLLGLGAGSEELGSSGSTD